MIDLEVIVAADPPVTPLLVDPTQNICRDFSSDCRRHIGDFVGHLDVEKKDSEYSM
jgi:hypothetical protein